MEFFSFVETFFFISLAITFVLIMMLVSHFKERITILEKKTNTVLDIINNIVQEINSLRMNSVQMIPPSNIPISNIPISNIFSKLSEIDVSENEESYDSDYENENENDEESSDIKANVETIKRINIDLNTKEEDVIDEIQVEHVIDEGEEEGEGEGEEAAEWVCPSCSSQ